VEADRVNILEDDLTYAQTICAHITGAEMHAQAMASLVGAKIAGRYFNQKEGYDVDSTSGLHNIGSISQFLDISDIYVNNAYVGVRVYFSEDELSVPETHYKAGLLPVVYMFIKLDEDLRHGTVAGFVLPNRIDTSHKFNGMIVISKDSLCSFEQIESVFNNIEESMGDFNEQIYQFIEGTLSNSDIANLFKHLIHSKRDRLKLLKVINAQSILSSVKRYETVSDSDETNDDIKPTESGLGGLIEFIDADKSDYSSFEYTTEITPSGADIIASMNKVELNIEDLENEQMTHDLDDFIDNVDDTQNEESIENAENSENAEEIANTEDIEALFDGNPKSVPLGKKTNPMFIVLPILIVILAGCIYLGAKNWNQITGFFNNDNENNKIESVASNINNNDNYVPQNINNKSTEAVMPVETVEPVKTYSNREEGNATTIPAIERSLDSSVLITNLKIEWEVPSGYAPSTAAKKYFIKLGKIIQLNLKAELLLLSKPPLSNRVTVELQYNATTEKFDVVGIKDSSGEKVVDDAIMKVVKNSLNHSASGISSFGKIQGNPIIVIRL